MARSSSVINVSIIGDASKLIAATQSADTATGGLVKSAAKTFAVFAAGAVSIDKAFDFLQTSLVEADRLGDAIFRLKTQIGRLSGPLESTAGNFAKLGASKQDIIELEAIFADFGTAAGIADPAIAAFAEQVATTATALSLIRDESPEELLGLITKAAGGSEKAARLLGVELIDTKDAGAQLTSILGQLKPALDAATTASGDLEQNQRELQARIETLSGELGTALSPALADVLTILLDIAKHDWGNDFARIGWGVGEILTPLARANDGLQEMLRLLGLVAGQTRTGHILPKPSGGSSGGTSDRNTADAYQRWLTRNGLGT